MVNALIESLLDLKDDVINQISIILPSTQFNEPQEYIYWS
jgi:hypothetical protein